MSTITKREYDERLFDINMAPIMREEDTIASVDDIIVDDIIRITDITHDPSVVQFKAAGGEQGKKYPLLIRFTTATNPDQLIEGKISLMIDNDC